MRSLRTTLRTAVTLLAGVTVACVVAYAALLVAGLRPVAVYSGSMVPTLHVGSIAIDRPVAAGSVRVGDVITFSDPYVPNRLVTHRVVRIFHTPKGLAYRTKGDANAARDPWTIRLPDRVGRVQFSIPVAGYVVWYAHTREVRAALIAFSALFVLAGLLRRIWRHEPVAAAGDA
jgi:signal peptidase I